MRTTKLGCESGSSIACDIRSDSRGQVSFSVIAVVLLVSSTVAATFIAKNQLDQIRTDQRLVLLGAMERSLFDVRGELELAASSRAQSIMKGWSEFPINETKISDAFSSSILDYISSSFPRSGAKFSIEVTNWTGGLYFVERNTMDLVPSDSSSKATCEVGDQRVEYDSLPGSREETLSVVTANPYYVAVGNFTAAASSSLATLERSMSFQKPIVSALPFLESKLRTFESSSCGECSDLGRMVCYMLSTLAEVRVLEGYGQPMFNSAPNTTGVLTEIDVYRAVAVGLLLEQLRLFRTSDPEFSSAVESACGPGGSGALVLASSSAREVDPAELLLWFLGKTRIDIDPKTLVAEALFGYADQLVLKFMEYSGWLGALDTAKNVLDGMVSSIESIISYFTGEDKAQTSVRSWIQRALGSSTSDPSAYTELFSSAVDFVVPIAEKTYYIEDAVGNLYPVWVGNVSGEVDLPPCDLLGSEIWKEFYPSFKECQSSFKQLAVDSVMRIAFDIASNADVQIEGLAVDPTDGSDIFSKLANGTGSVALKLDPEAVALAGRALPLFSAQYALASKLSEFVKSRGPALVDLSVLAQSGYDSLAERVLESARCSYVPNLIVPVKQQLAEIVRNDVEFDTGWNVARDFLGIMSSILRLHLGALVQQVNVSVYKCDDAFAGPLVDSFASMLAFGSGSFPGIGRLIEGSIGKFARSIMLQKELSGMKRSTYIDSSARFEFWDGERASAEADGRDLEESLRVNVPDGLPPLRIVPYDPKSGYASMENLFPVGDMLVQLKRPWNYERDTSEYPNTHLTDLGNVSATPYSTQWSVSVLGVIELRVRSNNSELISPEDDSIQSERCIRIDISTPIVVHSAWPLMGVEYNPTNTAFSDTANAAKKFVDIVWKVLEPVIGWVKNGLERILGFAERIFDVLSSFATRMIKAIASTLQTVVENLQGFVQKVADSVLARAVKMFLDITGRAELRITVYGFIIRIQTNLPDLIYRHGNDLLRLMLYTDRFGPGITTGLRIARMADGSYDVLANGTIALKSAVIDVTLDPLMHVLRRFVEAHCSARNWGLDLMIPDVDPYDSAEASTADLPGIGGFLSNIPIPVLGLSASVEAGLRVKYSSPIPKDIVINEFESNPPGEDTGHEWVELYNPLGETKSVDGWTLSTVHGKSCAMEIAGTIPANGVEIFTFPEASIDNGDPGNAFNDGDSIVLQDPSGRTIDVTPMLRDIANDGRTNQRSWDGGPKWVFRDGSFDSSNGLPVLLQSSDFIAKALFEAFKEAFAQTKLEEVSASLDFVAIFAKRVLNCFIENILALVKEIVHEITFFLTVGLSDASGSAGAGFRASFVVTGDAIVDLLRWLIQSLATFIVNLGHALNPIAFPPFPTAFFGGLYLRFEVLFEVGLPKMMRALASSAGPRDRYCMAVCISPNIPALGRLVGKHWGNWSVDFGVYIEGIPKEFAERLFAVDGGDLVDFWLVKGRIYGN